MKLRIKLTFLVSTITIVVVAAISIITLSQSTKLQTVAATENLISTAGQTAMDIQRRYEEYLNSARTVADIMVNYEAIDSAERRSRYNDVLFGILNANPHYVSIYSLWKPNALDGRDAELGQYLPMYTRVNGKIEVKTHPNAQKILDNLSEKEIVIDPVSQVVNGEKTYIVGIGTPIIKGDKLVGIVGIDVNMKVMQSITEIKPYGTGRVAVISNNGIVMAHEMTSLIGTEIHQDYVSVLGTKGVEIIAESLKSGKSGVFEYGGREIVTFPFYVGNSENALTALASVPKKTVLASVESMTQFTVIVAIIAIAVSALIGFVTATGIVKPIVGVIGMLKDISEGEGDLTKRIKLTSKDEIGGMAHYFNLTLEKIRDLIKLIREQSFSLSNIGNELSNNMNNTAAGMNQISSSILSMNGQVTNQAASVRETNSTMQEITGNIEKLNEHIENQSSNIAESSSAVEEMIANIGTVTKTLIHNVENVKRLADASELGRTSLQGVSADIQSIAKESEGLLEITAVMENIASQTNLLSMNAAIEAAHAGESGKGFAVVADEIRKLAESSGGQSKTIAEVLKKMKSSIDKIMLSTDEVLTRFEAIETGVTLVSQEDENIRNSMEEQQTGSQQVLQAIANLNDITMQVRNGSSDMLEGSRKIIQESKKLGDLTNEVSGGVSEMSEGARQINEAVDRVNNLSNDNKNHIDTLVSEISRFKIE